MHAEDLGDAGMRVQHGGYMHGNKGLKAQRVFKRSNKWNDIMKIKYEHWKWKHDNAKKAQRVIKMKW